ncbi:MAG: nuclear transport factor 2 family protein [Bacteroidota bacterium]
MRQLCFLLLICLANICYAQDSGKEKSVKNYYTGFENNNWKTVAGQLAEDFSFTSSNNDDHIPVDQFREKCFATARFIKKVKFVTMMEKGNELMLLVEIITTDNKIVRNVDVYTFSGGKIKSIEVFFGAGSKYPGNKG